MHRRGAWREDLGGKRARQGQRVPFYDSECASILRQPPGRSGDAPYCVEAATDTNNDGGKRMNIKWKPLRHGALLALLMVGIATQALAVTLPLVASPQIPAAEGKVRLHSIRNGNVEIKLCVR